MADLEQVRGMLVPIPTPFEEDGSLDEALLKTMVRTYVDKGANTLVVFGSYGQGPAMSVEQRKRGLELVVEANEQRVPVLPDVGMVDPYQSCELAEHAKACGVTGIGVVGPYYYNDRRPDELMQHFEAINEAVHLPILLINNPSYQGYRISTEFVASLRERIPELFGVHPAHVTLAEIFRYQNDVGADFRVFCSPDTMFPGMLVGQSGVMSPQLSMSLETGLACIAAMDCGDHEEALRIQLAILAYLRKLDTVRPWFRGTQVAALRHIGFPVKRFPRVPTTPLPAEAAQVVRDAIDELRAATLG